MYGVQQTLAPVARKALVRAAQALGLSQTEVAGMLGAASCVDACAQDRCGSRA